MMSWPVSVARMADDRVELTLSCDEALEIDSIPGDWASIFTNLFTNSLQHGFPRPRPWPH
jgi:hypothetical protein